MSNYKIKLLAWLLVTLMLSACSKDPNSKDVIEKERIAEQSWPKWPEFEKAVPKPKWWDQVGIYYIDPMNHSREEYRIYLEKNDGPDESKRRFKVAYAKALKYQNDAEKISGVIFNGTSKVFIPLYEFYIANYMHDTWQSAHCEQCNDANATAKIGADLVSMKLDRGEVESSLKILESLMKLKYKKANLRTRYYLILSYRRALEHVHGKEFTRNKLEPMVRENIKMAEKNGDRNLMARWLGVLDKSLRTIKTPAPNVPITLN